MRAPHVPENRVTIGAHLLRYAFDVHQTDQHAGQIGRTCRTCHRYGYAVLRARADERDQALRDTFEVPTSAANAYATAIRPTTGGLTTAAPAAQPPADPNP
jgi:hypothetical protein